MEDTLRDYEKEFERGSYPVLILVLMEDTLRADKKETLQKALDVLILVLMEDTLRDRLHLQRRRR